MAFSIIIIIFIIVLTLIEAFSMYHLKKFSAFGTPYNYFAGIMGYIIALAVFRFSFSFGKMGVINHGWNIMSSFAGFLIGYFYFSEKLTKTEFIGATISLFGLFLMVYKKKT